MSETVETVRASFVEDEAHFIEAFRHRPKTTAKEWTRWSVTPVISLTLVTGLSLFQKHKTHDHLWWLPIAVAGLVFVLVWFTSWSPEAQERSLRAALKKQLPEAPVPSWFEFSLVGFLATGHNARSTHYPWQSIPRLVEQPDGFLVYTDGTTYFWFPATSFPSRTEADKVMTFARSAGVTIESLGR